VFPAMIRRALVLFGLPLLPALELMRRAFFFLNKACSRPRQVRRPCLLSSGGHGGRRSRSSARRRLCSRAFCADWRLRGVVRRPFFLLAGRGGEGQEEVGSDAVEGVIRACVAGAVVFVGAAAARLAFWFSRVRLLLVAVARWRWICGIPPARSAWRRCWACGAGSPSLGLLSTHRCLLQRRCGAAKVCWRLGLEGGGGCCCCGVGWWFRPPAARWDGGVPGAGAEVAWRVPPTDACLSARSSSPGLVDAAVRQRLLARGFFGAWVCAARVFFFSATTKIDGAPAMVCCSSLFCLYPLSFRCFAPLVRSLYSDLYCSSSCMNTSSCVLSKKKVVGIQVRCQVKFHLNLTYIEF
jgi:hypothetical protein